MKYKLIIILIISCLLLTACAKGRVEKFDKPSIKDDFCGPVMDFHYCKCAFHNEYCDQLGISSATANAYVQEEFDRWVAFLLKQFKEDCLAADGIYKSKYSCEYCDDPLVKQGDVCVEPEQKDQDKEETGFKPEGPLDADCNTTAEFDKDWKKYSDIDARIPVSSRSWEAQGIVRTHEQILALKIENFKLQRDMEIDRQIRLEARAYKDALVRNIKQNLIKATIRLAYTTYKTVESGISAGKSFKIFLTGTETLARAGGLLSTVKTVVPKDSKIAFDTNTITGKVANVGVETAYQAMEALGNPKDVAIKFMTETKKAVVPSADLTEEEINILRDQHITKKFVDYAISESYKVNAKRRAQVIANENKIKQLEADLAGWEAKEKARVQDMLKQSCLEQKKKYEDENN